MPTIDSRLLDGLGEPEITENFNRAMSMIDAKMDALKIQWGTPINAATASGTLTLDTNPAANNTMTIETTVYTFKAAATVAGDIAIGVDLAATKTNVIAAIKGTDGLNAEHAAVTCGTFEGNVLTITAKAVGPAGNITTSETFTAITNVFGAATLEGGLNGTVGAEGQIVIDENYIYVCTADNTTADANWKKTALT